MLNEDGAQNLALKGLMWIAADTERCGHFLGATGAAPNDLRARASEPEFLGFVLDFILMDDASVLEFFAEAGCTPDAPMRARALLPGGDLPNWT